jgi:patatin-like phospholipase/acyl hydrolase
MNKILSIDGGGLRGIYAATILKKIKENFKINFYDEFDIIIGTSTGSIIASAISLENIPIEEICRKYEFLAEIVFKNSIRKYIPLISKYDSKILEDNLNLIFRKKKMGEAKTKLMIPTTIINPPSTYIHKSINQGKTTSNNMCLTEVILSSCVAPTYFDPIILNNDNELYVDGGLWCNNPSIIALLEMLKTGIPLNEIKILSIGTCITNRIFNSNKKLWGFLGWKTDLINLFFDMQSIYPELILDKILPKEHYIRINGTNYFNKPLDKYDINLINIATGDYRKKEKQIDQFLKL